MSIYIHFIDISSLRVDYIDIYYFYVDKVGKNKHDLAG